MRRYTPTLIVGLLVGLGLGLLYTWVISPVKYIDTTPASLRADYRSEYLQMIARAFVVDGEVERARRRLAALGLGDTSQAVRTFAQQFATGGGDAGTLAALATLADALGASPASVSAAHTPAPTQAVITPTRVPVASPRPLPTPVPTATPVGVFQFATRSEVCNSEVEGRLIQVLTLDAQNAPVAGVEIVVEGPTGLDHFFTGLKPDIGEGYGDFTMLTGETYTVYPANSPGAAVSDLSAPICADGTPGSLRLEFKQP